MRALVLFTTNQPGGNLQRQSFTMANYPVDDMIARQLVVEDVGRFVDLVARDGVGQPPQEITAKTSTTDILNNGMTTHYVDLPDENIQARIDVLLDELNVLTKKLNGKKG